MCVNWFTWIWKRNKEQNEGSPGKVLWLLCCCNKAVLICRAAELEKEEMVQEYDNNIVGEVTNVDSEEYVKRKFVKQKKIYRK